MKRISTISKLASKCEVCPKVDSCDHKRMEMCALAEVPTKACADVGQAALVSSSMPVMRERIESPLSPFAYRDELEKALYDSHFGSRFMMYGA